MVFGTIGFGFSASGSGGGGGGLTSITANNGLTASTISNTQLGGALIKNTIITNASLYNLSITGALDGNGLLKVTNSAVTFFEDATTHAIRADGNSGIGIYASSADNYGVYGTSKNSIGVKAQSTNNFSLSATGNYITAGYFQVDNTSAGVLDVIRIVRLDSVSAQGVGISLETSTVGGSPQVSNRIVSNFTDINFASRTSQLQIRSLNNAVESTTLTLKGTGQLQLNKYVSGAFSGTAVNSLSIDALGNVITSSLSSTITADSGLTKTVNNIQLGSTTTTGSPILQNTYLNLGNFGFTINGGASATYNLLIQNTGVTKAEIIIDSTAFVMQTTTNATTTISGLDITSSFGGAGAIRRTDTSTGLYTGLYYLGNKVGWNVTDGITQFEYEFPPAPYVANSMLTDIVGDGVLSWTPITVITADNGITKTLNNVQLGSATTSGSSITASRYINVAGFGVQFRNTQFNTTTIYGGGLVMANNAGQTVLGITSTGTTAALTTTQASTNTVVTNFYIVRETTGTSANGIGQAIEYFTEADNNTNASSTKLISKWTTAAFATRTSQFEITSVNNGAPESPTFTLKGTGQLQLNNYGVGTFLNGGIYNLQVDASGNVFEGTGTLNKFGSWYHSLTQTALVNTPTPMRYNTIDISSGVSIVNDISGNPTKITVSLAGTYNIQFSAQMNRTAGGSTEFLYIWLRTNGVDVPFSNTQITFGNNTDYTVQAWNFFAQLAAGENAQIMWAVTDIRIQIPAIVPNLPIPTPATPSVILTVTRI